MAPTQQSRSQELIDVKLLLIGNSSVRKKQWLPEGEASAVIAVDLGCAHARNLPPSCSLFVDVEILQYCMSGTQAGGSGTEGQDEYMGLFLSSKWIGQALVLNYIYIVGHCRPRTFPDHHRGARGVIESSSVRVFTTLRFSPLCSCLWRSSRRPWV